MEEELLFPEKLYFRNSIVIGDLPENLDFGKLFSYFDNLSFWKLTGKKIIPDLQNRKLKAVVLTYEDEDSARLCNLRFKTASNIGFTLYDGLLLFHYCKRLDLTCDVRSRCVLISGVNCDKPKDRYLDLLGIFGTVSYLEFCSEGEIPKIRVEFTRATSAFAAMLSLQDTFGRDSVVSLEVPLFPVHPIGSFPSSDTSEPVKYAALNDPSLEAKGMEQQTFMSYSMNFYQDQSTFTRISGIQENTFHQKESIEEYKMEAVAFGTEKLPSDEVNYLNMMSNGMQDYLDKYAQENLLRFLQSTKKMMHFNTVWNKIILPLQQHKM